MYLVKTPAFIQRFFPNFVWRGPSDDKVLYLTFDDGPIPEVTPWVLDQLESYNAKGTFFCVGENVKKNPLIFNRVINAGHAVGNHTYNHLSGWASDNNRYFDNVQNCAQVVDSNLFRPPYGRLKPKQAEFLHQRYDIIMWDVLSGDFDPKISKEQCFHNVIKHTAPGSIIVFHDSLKAEIKLRHVLPKVLKYYAKKGYQFKLLPDTNERNN